MPVTRIKENQLTDSAVTNAKIANSTIAGGKLANNLTYGSNLVVSGNLTVSGTTTTVDTTTTTVSDPVLLLSSGATGSGSKDIGLIGERGDDTNVFIGWDESADRFIVATTSSADTSTTITVSDHADLQIGAGIVDDTLNVSGEATLASATVSDLTENQVLVPGASGALESTDKLTFDETTLAITGALTATTTAQVTGNITGGNLTTAGHTDSATYHSSGLATFATAVVEALTDNQVVVAGTGGAVQSTSNLTFDETTLTVTGAIAGTTTATITGNITGGNLTTAAHTSTATLAASGAITGATTAVITGNITGGNLITSGAITDGAATLDNGTITGGVAATFSGQVSAGSFTTAGALNADGATTLGQVTIDASSTVDLGANRVRNIAAPVADQDAASKKYVDDLLSAGFTLSDGSTTQPIAQGDTLLVSGTANEIEVAVSATDTLTIGLPDDVTIGDTLTITGNLVVQGTTTTVNTATSTLQDPIFQLGRGADNAALNEDDGKDRGLDMFYYDGSEKQAFMGWDNSASSFVFVPDATNTAEVISGAAGKITVGEIAVDNLKIDGNRIESTNTGGALELVAEGAGKVTLPTGNELVVTDLANTGVIFSTNGELTANATDLYYDGTEFSAKNINSDGYVAATGNVSGGNVVSAADVTTVSVTASGAITGATTAAITGNITGGNLITAGIMDSATIHTSGLATLAQATVEDLTDNQVVVATTGGRLANTAKLTFDETTLAVDGALTTTGGITATGAVQGGSLTDGTATISSGAISGATTGGFSGTVTAGAFNDGAATYDAGTITNGVAATFSGAVQGATVTGTTSVAGGNITISGDDITSSNGKVVINDASGDVDFIVESNNNANMLTVDGGSDAVVIGSGTVTADASFKVATTDSMIIPSGTTAQRPSTGVAGMIRYNSTTDSIEYYDVTETAFKSLTAEFTVITGQTFDGDDSETAFTLSSSQTTASCIVSINGVVQLPTTAYSVSGTTLTFTEAPATGDKIEVRQITTSSTITGLANGDSSVTLECGTSAIDTKGDIIPTVNEADDLGSSARKFKDLYLSSGTIHLGAIQIKESGGSMQTFASNGSTPASTEQPEIVKSGTDGVGNIGQSDNSFNTVFAKATSAQYADLAEKYEADADYEEGTVVMFGGDKEVTQCNEEGCTAVAGIISTNPAYSMNDDLEADHTAMVALVGRVPCKVTGSIKKGDIIISAGDGKGKASDDPKIGAVIGKALADSEGEGVIEVVVKH